MIKAHTATGGASGYSLLISLWVLITKSLSSRFSHSRIGCLLDMLNSKFKYKEDHGSADESILGDLGFGTNSSCPTSPRDLA